MSMQLTVVTNGPETFCKDQCQSSCGSTCQDMKIVMQTPPTTCHDKCQSDCGSTCQEDEKLISEATIIANAAFIATADLSLVEERLRKDGVIASDIVDDAITEYRKFMTLIANGHRGLSMISPIVDEVWHAHILHTQDYADFCQRTIGRFVHHQPNSSRDPIPATEGPRFVDIYKATYGELPEVWRSGGEISGRCAVA